MADEALRRHALQARLQQGGGGEGVGGGVGGERTAHGRPQGVGGRLRGVCEGVGRVGGAGVGDGTGQEAGCRQDTVFG